ncbi:hypothetical protein Daus18300_005756 [Diaporthe australafricana]|uniref:Uncharacterized protein n=1 Tax=Diaporthe australafricana TaxID=127596 RepID=A0ABR3WZV7_9PEZI
MLVRDFRRFSLVLGSAILLLLLCVRLVGPAGTETLLGLQVGDWSGGSPTSPHVPSYTSPFAVASPSALEAAFLLQQQQQQQQQQQSALTDGAKKDGEVPPTRPPPPSTRPPSGGSRFIGPNGEIVGFQPPSEVRPGGSGVLHTEIFSVSTKDRQYFPIRMGSARALNPNIIPHPRLENVWIVVAQKRGSNDDNNSDQQQQQPDPLNVEPSVELVCNAMFIDDALTCIGLDGRGFGEPTTLPIQPTAGDVTKCTGELEFFNLNVGPHDARVFYGPRNPYTIYGSNSRINCFGQWVQVVRGLIPDWGVDVGLSSSLAGAASGFADEFTSPLGTELQRPPPWGAVEKNWFVFWDSNNVHYIHHDVSPRRAFARLSGDGSAGPEGDLARLDAAGRDDACLARWLPAPAPHESIHQATNSLSVTLCRRADTGCVPDDSNTFIFAVLHHKAYRDFHSVYEPYVMVFRQRAPFEVWAVSSRPVWISGRGTVRGTGGRQDTTEMFYVTSMAWKNKGLKYHGYADDVLFLAFGIEDERAAGIDVQAGSLLANLGLCDDGEGGL